MLVLIFERVGAKLFAAELALEPLLFFGNVLVHEVVPQTVDVLERLALGGAVIGQAVPPAILLFHGHVNFGGVEVLPLGAVGIFVLLFFVYVKLERVIRKLIII